MKFLRYLVFLLVATVAFAQVTTKAVYTVDEMVALNPLTLNTGADTNGQYRATVIVNYGTYAGIYALTNTWTGTNTSSRIMSATTGYSWDQIAAGGSGGTNGITLAQLTTTSNALASSVTGTNTLILTAVTNALGPLPVPTISPAAGTYAGTQTITLANTQAGATMKYTLDNSTPTASNGTTYSAPFNISASSTVKAVALMSLHAPSSVASSTYTIGTGTLAYWGRSTNITLTGAQVEALSSTLRVTADGTYSFTSGTGYYYFAWPSAMGLATSFIVGTATPFPMFDVAGKMDIYDSASGWTSYQGFSYQTVTGSLDTYVVWRSQYPQSGAATINVGTNLAP